MIFSVASLVVGFAALILSIMFRKGTPAARNWLQTDGIVDERFALLFIPGFAALLLGMGLSPHYALFPRVLHTPWIVLCGIVALAGLVTMVWGITHIDYPEKIEPQWLRDRKNHR